MVFVDRWSLFTGWSLTQVGLYCYWCSLSCTRAPLKGCFTVKTRYTPNGALQPVQELLWCCFTVKTKYTPTGALQPVKELL